MAAVQTREPAGVKAVFPMGRAGFPRTRPCHRLPRHGRAGSWPTLVSCCCVCVCVCVCERERDCELLCGNISVHILVMLCCVCACLSVCLCERERHRDKEIGKMIYLNLHFVKFYVPACVVYTHPHTRWNVLHITLRFKGGHCTSPSGMKEGFSHLPYSDGYTWQNISHFTLRFERGLCTVMSLSYLMDCFAHHSQI